MTASTFTPPSQQELGEQYLYFLRTCRPKRYKENKRLGDLAELASLKAEACKRYAENLIACGEFPGPAWNRAIRSEILESETD